MTQSASLAVLTAGGPHAWIMINALRDQFGDFPVIVEEGEPPAAVWRRRRKLLGPLTVAHMQAARLPIKLTKRGTKALIDQMIEVHGLRPEPDASTRMFDVPSVNSDACRALLREASPKAVFVVSTRMIARKTLDAVDAPFINYHSGINPAYRGMFGGYFALANGEPEHFGATVHLIDDGVDTGDILYQSQVQAEPRDNFHTYLWRLAAGSREIVIQAVSDALSGQLAPRKVDLPSRQWFAPTLTGYISAGLRRGVW